MEQTIRADILNSFPPVDQAAVEALLQQEIHSSDVKFIVLDDDPTGVQTVHDISVYTDWSVESIQSGLMEPGKVFYIQSLPFEITDHTLVGSGKIQCIPVLFLPQVHRERLAGLKPFLFEFSKEQACPEEADSLQVRDALRHVVDFLATDLYPGQIERPVHQFHELTQFLRDLPCLSISGSMV